MPTAYHFPIFIAVSLAAFYLVLRFALRRRPNPPPAASVLGIASVVVVGGMIFAKYGANHGWHWAIYYGVPAALTLLLPPLAFRMRTREAVEYLILAWCTSPLIHVLFAFFLGWKEYLPFIHVPAMWEL
jgi:peptidoglycan/LPS O-acetylase OafA/YrhL